MDLIRELDERVKQHDDLLVEMLGEVTAAFAEYDKEKRLGIEQKVQIAEEIMGKDVSAEVPLDRQQKTMDQKSPLVSPKVGDVVLDLSNPEGPASVAVVSDIEGDTVKALGKGSRPEEFMKDFLSMGVNAQDPRTRRAAKQLMVKYPQRRVLVYAGQ